MAKVKNAFHDEICAAEYDDLEPDFEGECMVCGCGPTVPLTGLCGPCSFGEADTVGGNW